MGTEEHERTWLTPPGDGARFMHRLAALSELEAHTLGPVELLLLEDSVLDDGNGTLTASELTLRLRRRGDPARWRLTVKGPGQVDADGSVRRVEWEADWSQEACGEGLRQLAALGAGASALPTPATLAENFSSDDPIGALSRLGWRTVHRRRTERRRRAVIGPTGAQQAELALDQVTFRIGGRDLLHREVELERAPSGAASAYAALVERIDALAPPEVRAWSPSKTALGAALEGIGVDGRSDGQSERPLTTEDGELLPTAYTAVEEWLRDRPG